MSKIIIRSAALRFRRAGIEFTRDGVTVDTGDLSEDQLAAIEAEPQLSVRPADDDPDQADSKADKKPKAGKSKKAKK